MGDANPPAGLPPLPPGLAAAFAAATSGGRGKRERTQSALVRAAVQVFCARGVAQATVQEVAQVAGMTAATVYNHFASKEALVAEVAVVLAQSLCRAIAQSHAAVADAAQRMAIGQRRYIWLAAQSPPWALLLLEMASASPGLLEYIQKYPLADLRAGLRQKRFTVPNEAVAMDAINGICTMAMRRVALGEAPARHDVAAATLVLRALGLDAADAAEVAKRPLPDLPVAEAEAQPPAAARRGRARTPR
ncbi:MAG: TetR family transcriptional regulator [Ramlibacter sp.]|jgi:AcrR family transcriptional regulator|nr:TetR family transcriptional regulator [Ramlibacter sp.]